MKLDIYKCDVCETEKKNTNCWWKLVLGYDPRTDIKCFFLMPWDAELDFSTSPLIRPSDMLHLCGQSCVLKKLNHFMNPEFQRTGPESVSAA